MINEIFSFSFGQRKESFTSIHGSSSLLLSFCGFSSLFFLYCDSVCHFYHKCDITPSCKQCSLQLLLSLPISNDAEMATKLSDASLLIKYNKKSHIKGRAPAFILSAFFFRIRIFFFKACILQYQLCRTVHICCSCGNRCLVFTKLVLCLSPK